MLLRRARIARLVEMGNRVGYGLFGLAVVAFVVGAAAGFSTPDTIVVVACLGVGSAVLAPAIVFGYGVKAAEREDRQRTAGSLPARAAGSDPPPPARVPPPSGPTPPPGADPA